MHRAISMGPFVADINCWLISQIFLLVEKPINKKVPQCLFSIDNYFLTRGCGVCLVVFVSIRSLGQVKLGFGWM